MDDLGSYRKSLFESLCDNRGLLTVDCFDTFYEYINALSLREVGRPQADLVLLFKRPAASIPGRFESFGGAL
jgi:hypothetical protein